jgi:hypothetical protein
LVVRENIAAGELAHRAKDSIANLARLRVHIRFDRGDQAVLPEFLAARVRGFDTPSN